MVFETSKAFVGGKAGPNYPAPVAAIEAIEKAARKGRDEALPIETEAFVRIARTPVAAALVSVFLGDQVLKKIAKKASKGRGGWRARPSSAPGSWEAASRISRP